MRFPHLHVPTSLLSAASNCEAALSKTKIAFNAITTTVSDYIKETRIFHVVGGVCGQLKELNEIWKARKQINAFYSAKTVSIGDMFSLQMQLNENHREEDAFYYGSK